MATSGRSGSDGRVMVSLPSRVVSDIREHPGANPEIAQPCCMADRLPPVSSSVVPGTRPYAGQGSDGRRSAAESGVGGGEERAKTKLWDFSPFKDATAVN
ncbi:hypothetical protein GCM10020369_73870 [Cryptosporangium minutisporangium]|uniref:Uncharacterized protein n=1 Tax=Cryptosporangium minutisporangium TaxID=113569 RepID=A0ABP6TB74_9ACTN